MDIKTSVLVFTLLVGCIALPASEDDLLAQQNARIVGGTEAAIGAHPHMVVLTTGTLISSFFCAGSLVTQRSIITAAHCIAHVYSFRSLSSSLRATVGTNRWNRGGDSYRLSHNVSHPHYVSSTIKNDLGLLITTTNVALSNLVQPVAINYNYIPENVPVRVTGWGRTRAGGSFSNNLLEIWVTTYNSDDCVEAIRLRAIQERRTAHHEPHIELCTYHSVGVGTCQGDSGGPLLDANNQLIGSVSWGFPCAGGTPDIFVRLSAFQGWLQSSIV